MAFQWSPELQHGYKLIRLKCTGLPLHAWDLESFSKVVAAFGMLVTIDEATMKMNKLSQ